MLVFLTCTRVAYPIFLFLMKHSGFERVQEVVKVLPPQRGWTYWLTRWADRD